MSIAVPGKLNIIERKYRNGSGSFFIGELDTDVGKFSIRNDVLMQFETGSYEGNFMVARIFPHSFTTQDNRIFTEIRADLDWEALRIMAETELLEPPSIVQEAVAQAEEAAIEQEQVEQPRPDRITTAAPSVGDEALIADMEALEQQLADQVAVIKLDSAIAAADRDAFRSLIKRIKATGQYRFSPDNQSWLRN